MVRFTLALVLLLLTPVLITAAKRGKHGKGKPRKKKIDFDVFHKKFEKEVTKGSLTNVKKMLKEADGAPIVNYQDFGKTGMTSLMIAAQKGHDYIFDTLLANGGDVNKKDGTSWTTLMHACETGRSDIALKLLKRGADPCHRSKGGVVALHLIAPFFQEKKAQVNNN